MSACRRRRRTRFPVKPDEPEPQVVEAEAAEADAWSPRRSPRRRGRMEAPPPKALRNDNRATRRPRTWHALRFQGRPRTTRSNTGANANDHRRRVIRPRGWA